MNAVCTALRAPTCGRPRPGSRRTPFRFHLLDIPSVGLGAVSLWVVRLYPLANLLRRRPFRRLSQDCPDDVDELHSDGVLVFRSRRGVRKTGLRHPNPSPECDSTSYRCRGFIRFWVVLGGVLVDLAIHHDVVVAGLGLPGAMRMRPTF